MGALLEGLLEYDFFIPTSKFKMWAYLQGLLGIILIALASIDKNSLIWWVL